MLLDRLPKATCFAALYIALILSTVLPFFAHGDEGLTDHSTTTAAGDGAHCDPDADKEVKELLKQAEKLQMKKKYREAISLYAQAIRLNPQDLELVFKRSRLFSKVGNYQLEIDDLSRVLTGSPDHIKANAFYGKAMLQAGDCDASVVAYKKVLALKPSHGDAKKKLPKAEKCVEELNLVRNEIAEGKLEEAENHITELIDSLGKPASLSLLRAQTRYNRSRYYEAIADCADILKKDSANIDALLLRGVSFYKVGEYEMTKRHMKEIISSDPDNSEAKAFLRKVVKISKLSDLGTTKIREGQSAKDWQEGLEALTEAVNIDTSHDVLNQELYTKICEANMKLDALEAARKACDAAINIDAGLIEPHILFAEMASKVAENTSQCEEALRAWQRAHEVDRNNPRVQEGMRKAETALKQSKQVNFYKTLGVSRKASLSEIKKAYRVLAMEYHPDRHGTKSEEERLEMQQKFEEIAKAYEVLSDEDLRQRYDRGEDVFDNNGNQGGGQGFGGFHHGFHGFPGGFQQGFPNGFPQFFQGGGFKFTHH